MIRKEKIGTFTIAIITLIVLLLTIRFSGHRHSLGIFVLGLFCLYFIAILIGAVLNASKLITKSLFYVFSAGLFVSLLLFFFYHHSYDSYHETRSLFWGFNGE